MRIFPSSYVLFRSHRKECLRCLDDYVRALEPYYTEAALIYDIRSNVQHRTKYITNLPDWRAYMDNHQWEMLLTKGDR